MPCYQVWFVPAVNASRAKRAMMSHYQTYYEERAKSLDSIIEKFKHQTTFEEFVGSVYCPNGQGTIIQGSSSSASISISNHSRSDMSNLASDWEETRPRAHTSNAADHESVITQMQDVSNQHIQLRNRVSVVGIPGSYSQVINEESALSDKPGPYKTTTHITNRFKQTTRNVQI